ncbi:cysteine synthase CysM [Halothiobacillus sp. DCM-1]|uniref:cysteine synthase CysM n=1 Tax=Halothiobacillus sp. DCM-1 TaxID=3112558 RepID=UPI0032479901
MQVHDLADWVGNTPLVRIARLAGLGAGTVLAKLEGNNPAGSVKDRPALHMIRSALQRGTIRPGDRLIEATSGNTGIALAMVAATLGLKMTLIMPDNMSLERRQSMAAYGAELILVPKAAGMEGARDLATQMATRGEGVVLDQFSNADNPAAHFATTGPEIWRDTEGRITHFVSAMGTTGTIVGTGQFLKSQNPAVQIVGVQPADGAQIPGIRRWPAAYLPKIYRPEVVDRVVDIDQPTAEETTRQLARREGILAGISSGGAMAVALRIAQENPLAVIVTIVCDRGDRYLSTGVFPAA